jgi:alkaline phosphatase D
LTRKTVPLLLAAAGLASLPANAFAARGFHYGVTAAEITSKSAIVWARPDRAGRVTAEVSRSRLFSGQVERRSLVASTANDLTVQTLFRGLKPRTVYHYRFRGGRGARSDVGTFRTAPAANSVASFTFGWSGDADAQRAAGSTRPFFNNFGVYRRMARAGNDFAVNLGDTIYSDSEVPGQEALATSVAAKDAKYKQNLALKNLQLFREASGVYNHWDDHEFQNDFSKPEFGNAIYQAGVKAFRQYMPVTYRPSTGIYRSFRWGRNAEIFFPDERSFRSAKASANHVCDNPQTGKPDNAPTAPQQQRTLFAVVAPEFTSPVSQQCLNTINDPSRTFLGKAQLARFERALKASKARWKIVMNETPIQQFYGLPYDRWEGYAAERTQLLTFLKNNVKNVVFLTTDVHANLVNDARLKTLEPGGPLNSGVLEATTGPVATGTFSKEIDQTLNKPGSGQLITRLFFKTPPPNGPGMQCANTNVFSYGEVHVTSRRLTITLLDSGGKSIKDVNGGACGPFRLTAK